jgi:hypothetical protein
MRNTKNCKIERRHILPDGDRYKLNTFKDRKFAKKYSRIGEEIYEEIEVINMEKPEESKPMRGHAEYLRLNKRACDNSFHLYFDDGKASNVTPMSKNLVVELITE